MYELFRDDDISSTSNITLLQKVHDQFITYDRIHTVAVLMDGVWDNKEVWYWLMTAPNLQIGLHGWSHLDYSTLRQDVIEEHIRMSLNYYHIHALRGKYQPREIKTFFPPWNRVSDELRRAVENMGMVLDNRVGPPVFNFHYWACQDRVHMDMLSEALRS